MSDIQWETIREDEPDWIPYDTVTIGPLYAAVYPPELNDHGDGYWAELVRVCCLEPVTTLERPTEEEAKQAILGELEKQLAEWAALVDSLKAGKGRKTQ